MSSRLESFEFKNAFFLLRNCPSMPRLLFKLISSPCYRQHSELTQLDETLRQAASTVCNVNLDDTGRKRSTHAVALGGFGLSSAVNVPSPAYASNLCASRPLVSQILEDESGPTSEVDSVAERWTEQGHELTTADKKPFLRYWSTAVHEALFRNLKANGLPGDAF